LGLSAREHSGVFRYSTDGKHFTDVGKVLDSRVLSDEFDSLGFTGAFVGMFCVDTARYEATADFKRFSYRRYDA
ncbi:MAG: glycoside hydrolase family 43 protein, partial [Treponema sp.]|nr:glycoside hydrolase family 43 protein [Treponema sp.]